jgi:asparagine synthase (glutamine-hydrolysing)
MTVDAHGVQVHQYWDWPFGATVSPASEEQCAEELRELLIDAVRLQLRADVPVGAYLSGGLDSSIITTIVRKHTQIACAAFR